MEHLRSHLRIHTEEKQNQCDVCDMVITNKIKVKLLNKLTCPISSFWCNFCSVLSTLAPRWFICKNTRENNLTFAPYAIWLINHLFKMHRSILLILFKICYCFYQTFISRANLTHHERIQHSSNKAGDWQPATVWKSIL